MLSAKQLCLLGLAASCGLSAAQVSSTRGSHPCDFLFKALERSKKVSVEAIVLRTGAGDRNPMKMKLEQANGLMRLTVLEPISRQGVITINDGVNWTTYLPDEDRVMVQPSPKSSMTSDELRELAKRNYRVKYKGSDTICGRPASVLAAVPGASEMPVRTYTIDRETLFVYRIETQSDEVRRLVLDTQYASFPTKTDTSDWKINPLRPARTMRMPAPTPLPPSTEAKLLIGFVPAAPANLPFGFEITEGSLAGRAGSQFAAIRLTDGLANATIYQWSASKVPGMRGFGPTKPVQAKGVSVQAVGDLPAEVLSRLVDAFIKEILKGLLALSGTDGSANALVFSPKGQGDCIVVVIPASAIREP